MLDQLKQKGRHFANRCPLCSEDVENVDHMLLLCRRLEIYGPFFCSLWDHLGSPLFS